MKRTVFFLLILFFTIFTALQVDAKRRKKRINKPRKIRVTINGYTKRIKTKFVEKKVTVRLKKQGERNWFYNKKIRVRVKKSRQRFMYYFKLKTSIKAITGQKVYAEAFSKLDDGREIYKIWVMKIKRRSRKLGAKVVLNKYRGKKIDPTDVDETLSLL